MNKGRVIAAVGPSGVGKDAVLTGLAELCPRAHLVRRVITRAPGLGGEDYESVDETTFAQRVVSGAFALHWDAHGLRYGIPVAVRGPLAQGCDCFINISRTALLAATEAFPCLFVLNITARPDTLAARLQARGREGEAEIAQRLRVADKPLLRGLPVIHLSNDGPLDQTVAQAAARLHPARV